MSRRARHTSSDLRELFIDSTTGLISEHGLSAVSARTIARKIGYTAGSLYNVFQDLDDLLLLTEARQIDRLHGVLLEAAKGKSGDDAITACANAYLGFCLENARLWNLVVVHQTGPKKVLPDWYAEKLDALSAVFDQALSGLIASPEVRAVHARALWATVHGFVSLAISGKAPNLSPDGTAAMLDGILATYLKGMKSELPAARPRQPKEISIERPHAPHGG